MTGSVLVALDLCPGDSVTVKSSIPLFWVFSLVLGGSTSRNIGQHIIYCKNIAEVYSLSCIH